MFSESPYNILIADDESNFREVVKDFLISKNYNVICSENKEETIRKILDFDVHVLLLDKRFPRDSDGIEVLREVKKFKPQVEVVMLTAYPEPETNLESMKMGAAAYLLKTGDYERLLNSIEHLIEVVRLKKKNQTLLEELQKKNAKLELSHETVQFWNEELRGKLRNHRDVEVRKMEELEGSKCKLDNAEMFVLGLIHEINKNLHASEPLFRQIHETSVEQLAEAIKKLSFICQEMLDISKSYFELVLLPGDKKVEFDVQKILEKALFLGQINTLNKKIQVTRDFEVPFPKIPGNPRRILEAFLNILKFSFHSVFENPETNEPIVSVGGYKQEKAIVIEVANNSGPVSSGDEEDIFQPDVTKKLLEWEIGLPWAKKYIEEHHGSVVFIRTTDQKNLFRVTLPTHMR